MALASPLWAADTKLANLGDLSLEQLSNIEVTSVSRRAERLQDAAASIYVITADDIRRSGVTSLPDALRLAPNLQVARTNASQYAVSARGFNNTIANKLLVLIDGRTVYTPLFSGVFWDAQSVMLEDIDRIEVISGPGATLWGSNAVNGVINILTRSARETQGTLLALGAGTREHIGAVRYGGELGANGHYRVYGRYFDRPNTEFASGASAKDGWNKGQAGFRTDWSSGNSRTTLQGDVYHGELERAVPGQQRISGANLLARWNRQLAGGSTLNIQGYYDRTERSQPRTFTETLDIFDIEFQHSIPTQTAHQLQWGGGYRYAFDRVGNTAALAFLPGDRNLKWGNLFVQDEIALRQNLALTLGAKVETNVYTGAEILPSARLGWKLDENHLLWGAVSRAVRAPARLDRDLFVPGGAPFLLSGGPNFQSEVSKVIEGGYRAQPSPALSYSLTLFHHIYERQRTVEPAGGTLVIDNKVNGHSNGIEAWGTYHATRAWRLSAGFMGLREHLGLTGGSTNFTAVPGLGNNPGHQWLVRSSLDFGTNYEFDVFLRHVGTLPNPNVPSYTAVDLRLGWRLQPDLELSLTAQNLFGPGHIEFGTPATASEFERGVFLKLVWRR
jgi:iron complex outermembrane receptor protein